MTGALRDQLKLDDEEQEAMDGVQAALRIIVSRWRLKDAQKPELVAAVHVIQGYIQQHLLHRLDPDSWSNWWDK